MTTAQQADAPRAPVFDRQSAQGFCAELAGTLELLIGVLERETALVKAGKLREAAALAEEKSAAARDYARAHSIVKHSSRELGRLAPVEIDGLRRFSARFESVVAGNLAVMATARTVSEGLIRGVAEALSATSGRSHTYNAEARRAQPAPAAGAIRVDVAL